MFFFTFQFVDTRADSRYHPLIVSALGYRLPLITLVAGVGVYSLLLVLMITSGAGLTQPFNLVLLFLLAATVVLMFLALNPNNVNAALMLWFGAGVWGAAGYLNFQMLGFFALGVAVLCAVTAFWIERESRAFSFTGPALFIGVALSLVIVANLLAR